MKISFSTPPVRNYSECDEGGDGSDSTEPAPDEDDCFWP